jgi:hypothetical protein
MLRPACLVTLIGLLSGMLLANTTVAQVTLPIEHNMSVSERHATGLDNLSAEQLQALNTWLQLHGAVLSPPQATAPLFGEPATFQDIVARIPGEFTGWDGNTLFNLDNGQVYQQRRPGRWDAKLSNPEVRIRKNLMGLLELEVQGHSIGVRRLR